MAGAFFFICMFVITVCGLLLFRPVEVHTITDYSAPTAIEERKKVAVKMAQYLEKNPQIVEQKRFKTLTPPPASYKPTAVTDSNTQPESMPDAPPVIGGQLQIPFQGATLQFKNFDEYNKWLYKSVNDDPSGFLKQLHENDNPELYLDTLKKVSEISSQDMVQDQIKERYLDVARNMISNKDGYHQQMMQKALQNYLDLEKDKELGKKTADEILKNQ